MSFLHRLTDSETLSKAIAQLTREVKDVSPGLADLMTQQLSDLQGQLQLCGYDDMANVVNQICDDINQVNELGDWLRKHMSYKSIMDACNPFNDRAYLLPYLKDGSYKTLIPNACPELDCTEILQTIDEACALYQPIVEAVDQQDRLSKSPLDKFTLEVCHDYLKAHLPDLQIKQTTIYGLKQLPLGVYQIDESRSLPVVVMALPLYRMPRITVNVSNETVLVGSLSYRFKPKHAHPIYSEDFIGAFKQQIDACPRKPVEALPDVTEVQRRAIDHLKRLPVIEGQTVRQTVAKLDELTQIAAIENFGTVPIRVAYVEDRQGHICPLHSLQATNVVLLITALQDLPRDAHSPYDKSVFFENHPHIHYQDLFQYGWVIVKDGRVKLSDYIMRFYHNTLRQPIKRDRTLSLDRIKDYLFKYTTFAKNLRRR